VCDVPRLHVWRAATFNCSGILACNSTAPAILPATSLQESHDATSEISGGFGRNGEYQARVTNTVAGTQHVVALFEGKCVEGKATGVGCAKFSEWSVVDTPDAVDDTGVCAYASLSVWSVCVCVCVCVRVDMRVCVFCSCVCATECVGCVCV